MPEWTDERACAAAALWQRGKSASEIAAIFGDGCTPNIIIGKLNRLGLIGKPRLDAPALVKPLQSKPSRARKAPVIDRKPAPVSPAPPVEATPEPARPPAAPPAAPVDVLVFSPVSFVDLKEDDRRCRRPVEGHDGFYCGKPTPARKSWCVDCAKLMTIPVDKLRQNKLRDSVIRASR